MTPQSNSESLEKYFQRIQNLDPAKHDLKSSRPWSSKYANLTQPPLMVSIAA